MKSHTKWIIAVVAAALAGIVIGRGCAGREHDPVGADGAGTAEPEIAFWTCSMHPDVRRQEPGLCPKCAMDLIPVTDDDDDEAMGLRELKLSPAAQALAEVETAVVERRFATAEIRMVGKVDFDETRLAYITAWVPGRLDRLFADFTGIEVRKGDHMVSLYSPELIAAQEELIQAVQTERELGQSDNPLIRDRAASTVESTREKLRLWGLTREQIAEIEQRGTPEDHLTIYSPIGGVVVHKDAQEGMYVDTGSRIYTIADLSRVWVRLDAYESDLSWLHYGQEVRFESESYPGRAFHGTIAFIDPVLDEKSRTVNVRVNVDNQQGDLKPGMFVRAVVSAQVAAEGRVFSSSLAGKWISPMHPEIVKDEPGECDVCGMDLVSAESLGYVLGEPEEAPLVIPASAALLTGKRAIVYVKSPDRPGVFEGREVVLGPRAGDLYLVRRGLQEGEQVVTKGSFKLDAELQIRAKPSMMTPGGGGGGGAHDHGDSMRMTGEGGAEEVEAAGMPGLTSLARSRLQAVLAAANAATEAAQKGEDLEAIREAFEVLSERVEALEDEDIVGHAAMLWKEHAMLLGNDGVEGGSAGSMAEARRVAALLGEHTASMTEALGLDSETPSQSAPTIDPGFLRQFGRVLAAYLDIQRALVVADHAAATAAATEALDALAEVDMTLVTGANHDAWMRSSASLEAALSDLAGREDLDAARTAFLPLSEAIMAAAKRFGAPDGPLYQFRCPMAFDGEGATWVQDDRELKNPYYGDQMLRCGTLIEALAGGMAEDGHHHDD